jgi:hypothetical protein
MLAGDFLMAFGGFFHLGARHSDFALGFSSMLNWMADSDNGLLAYGLDQAEVDTAVNAALLEFGKLTFCLDGVCRGFSDYLKNTDLQERVPAAESWKWSAFGQLSTADLTPEGKRLYSKLRRRIVGVAILDWLGITRGPGKP